MKQSNHDTLLQLIKDYVRNYTPPASIAGMYVHGSYARRQHTPMSDMDLVAIVDNSTEFGSSVYEYLHGLVESVSKLGIWIKVDLRPLVNDIHGYTVLNGSKKILFLDKITAETAIDIPFATNQISAVDFLVGDSSHKRDPDDSDASFVLGRIMTNFDKLVAVYMNVSDTQISTKTLPIQSRDITHSQRFVREMMMADIIIDICMYSNWYTGKFTLDRDQVANTFCDEYEDYIPWKVVTDSHAFRRGTELLETSNTYAKEYDTRVLEFITNKMNLFQAQLEKRSHEVTNGSS